MTPLNRTTAFFGFLAWLSICSIALSLGAMASIQAESFYSELTQPSWAPPSWLFGPVWTTLYVMMAVSAWLVWKKGGFLVQACPLGIFLIQLSFNALWSWLFFAWHQGGLAFVNILILMILITRTLFLFWQTSKLAALLLIPYLFWVGFAGFLNYSVWQLNPATL